MVRNFWLEARIDERKNPLYGGPRQRDGGFDLLITQRHQGTIQDAVTIVGGTYGEWVPGLCNVGLKLVIRPSSTLRWEWTGDRLVIYSER